MANKKAVLIAEESLAMVQLYKGLLAAYDCIVHQVASIQEARERMMRYEYDLYILDTKLDNQENGTDLIGKGGAKPDKCLILSGNLPEDKVTELVDFYKVPRNMIMIKPPDAKAFIAIANKYLAGGSSPDDTVLHGKSEIIPSKRKFIRILKRITLKGWIAVVGFMLVLPTTIETTFNYLGYRQYVKFEHTKAEYCKNKFDSLRPGDKISTTTYIEETKSTESADYVLRYYPEGVAYIKVIPKDKKEKVRETWLVGPKYLEAIELKEDMTFIDIFRAATKF